MAFYAEVVVAQRGKTALPGAALEKALCQGDACGYAVALHLLYCQVLKLADIELVSRVLRLLCVCS